MFVNSTDYLLFDSLLNSEDVTTDALLSHPLLLDECRCQNKKLLSILMSPLCLSQLIEVVISGPDTSASPDMQFKKHHICCEILSSGVSDISGALLCNLDCLDLLYERLDAVSAKSPLTLIFIHRIFIELIKYNKYKILQYFCSKPDFIDIIVSNIDRPAISDLVYQLLQTDLNESCTDLAQVMNDGNIVEQLLKLFNSEEDGETHSSVMHFLTGLVTICRSQSYCGHKAALLDALESTQTLNFLLSQMFNASNDNCSRNSLLRNGIFFVICLINPSVNIEGVSTLLPALPNECECCIWSTSVGRSICSVVCPYLPTIKEWLSISDDITDENDGSSGYPSFIKPVTATRLSLVRFLRYLWECRDERLITDLYRLDILSNILDMFFRFPYNTFLHSTFYNLVHWIIKQALFNCDVNDVDTTNACALPEPISCSSDPIALNFDECQSILQNTKIVKTKAEYFKDELTNEALIDEKDSPNTFWRFLHQLIVDHKILDLIRTSWRSSSPNKLTHRRPGYFGHLRMIANLLTYVIGPLPMQPGGSNSDLLDVSMSVKRLNQIAENGLIDERTFYNSGLQKYLRAGVNDEAWLSWCEFVQLELANANKVSFIDYDEFNATLLQLADVPITDVSKSEYLRFVDEPISNTLYMERFGICEDQIPIVGLYAHKLLDNQLNGLNFSLSINEDWENSHCFEQVCNELIQLNAEEVGKNAVCIEENYAMHSSLTNQASPGICPNAPTTLASTQSEVTTSASLICPHQTVASPEMLYKIFCEVEADHDFPGKLEDISLESILKAEFNVMLANDDGLTEDTKEYKTTQQSHLVASEKPTALDIAACNVSCIQSNGSGVESELLNQPIRSKVINEKDYWIDVTGRLNTVNFTNRTAAVYNEDAYSLEEVPSCNSFVNKQNLVFRLNDGSFRNEQFFTHNHINGLSLSNNLTPESTYNTESDDVVNLSEIFIPGSDQNISKLCTTQPYKTRRLIMPTKRSSLQQNQPKLIWQYDLSSQLYADNNGTPSSSSILTNFNCGTDVSHPEMILPSNSSNAFQHPISTTHPGLFVINENTNPITISTMAIASSADTIDDNFTDKHDLHTLCMSDKCLPGSYDSLESDTLDSATKPKYRTHRILQLRPHSESQLDEI